MLCMCINSFGYVCVSIVLASMCINSFGYVCVSIVFNETAVLGQYI